MARYRLTASAQADLLDIFAWTHAHFGEQARHRYEALVIAALRDIAAQPERAGSIERPELGDSVRSWHLRLSRDRARTPTGMVRRPRHFLLYRQEAELVAVARVLHDAMELSWHLNPESSWD